MKTRGLYVHIPFCAKKCNYCDFTSYVYNGNELGERINSYLDSVEKEIEFYKNLDDDNIETIFIGGGTPSILNEEQLEKLFKTINKNVNLEKIREYTIECNPGTLTIEKMKVMKKGGVNRLSIGLQAIQEKHLSFMGRVHNLSDFEESYINARKMGFDNINVDLIFAFDGQSFEDWKATVDYVIKLGVEHISAYSLIIEENTKFYRLFEEGKLEIPEDDLYIKMYRYTVEKLKENGYIQYEISNYSKENRNCIHNINYWECGEYYGIGVGASGYINGKRYTNFKDIEIYNKKCFNGIKPINFEEKISRMDKFNEKLMLGLRMNSGIDEKIVDILTNEEKNFFNESINKYKRRGLIGFSQEKKYYLTQKGREISNSIIIDLMI